MRTVFFEEEMLKTRRSDVMKEYKSAQPKHQNNSKNPFSQYQVIKGVVKIWDSIFHKPHFQRDEPEFEPVDS
jgi:hypothetical protein